jgi:hypothetical protein
MKEIILQRKNALVLAAYIFGGAGIGILSAYLLAPNSEIALLFGLIMLPLCFGVCSALWRLVFYFILELIF